jgi:hypothetical protein
MTERRLILPLDGLTTHHEPQQVARQPRERARRVEEAIELFEETFAARRNVWRSFAKEKEERAKKAAEKAAADPWHHGNRVNVLR